MIDLYYGEDGIGYTLGRVHIGSCDFSLKSYSFNDIAGDYAMQYFDTEVTHDNAQMLPLMRLAINAAKEPAKSDAGVKIPRGIPNGVNILASPWSPPPWMKQPVEGSQNMTGESLSNIITCYYLPMKISCGISDYISLYEEVMSEVSICRIEHPN